MAKGNEVWLNFFFTSEVTGVTFIILIAGQAWEQHPSSHTEEAYAVRKLGTKQATLFQDDCSRKTKKEDSG